MTPSPVRDMIVGLFVFAALAAVAYLSANLGGVSYGGPPKMELIATFDEVGGLTSRSQVVIGGVKIGEVKAITLDADYRAKVVLLVDAEMEIPDDSSASILTAGVLGNQYLGIEPGGSDVMLKSGEEIPFTQSALVLERLIGKLVQSLGGSSE